MTYKLRQKERDALLNTPDSARYKYSIGRIADWQEVWSLHGSTGWVLAGSPESGESIPVWPHRDFAQIFAVGEWNATTPKGIGLADWLDKWIPGLMRDGRSVTVFPVAISTGLHGIKVSPERFRDDLSEELSRIE